MAKVIEHHCEECDLYRVRWGLLLVAWFGMFFAGVAFGAVLWAV